MSEETLQNELAATSYEYFYGEWRFLVFTFETKQLERVCSGGKDGLSVEIFNIKTDCRYIASISILDGKPRYVLLPDLPSLMMFYRDFERVRDIEQIRQDIQSIKQSLCDIKELLS